jgi:hypothetical protein|tara:strand:- start:1185 stop:2042 length:858 start_codon:yes stop_codon:yes gene_type:complete
MTALNSGIPTFISGPVQENTGRSLFAVGPVTCTHERSLFASGPAVGSGDTSVFTSGPVPETSSPSLFTAGPYPASGQSTLLSVSGGINNAIGPLYLQSDTNAGGGEERSDALLSLYASGSNFVHSDSDQGIAPLRIEAPIKSGVSSDSTLFMQTVPEVLPTPSGVSTLYIEVEPSVIGESGGESINSNISLIVTGNNPAAVYEGTYAASTLFIESTETHNEDFNVFIRSPKTDSMPVYISNFESINDNFSITVDGGGIPNSGEITMFISPPTAKTISTVIKGYLE